MNKEVLQEAANNARGLAMDAIAACNSGHLGLPLGAAEVGAVLYGEALKFNPDNPGWLNRDRFVLSGGHGSMFLYSWLHIAGYDVSRDDLRSFRKLHSKTPGHPEFGETDGVECTTGPLGQGIGNAVGMAAASKMAAAHFNTEEHTIFDNIVVALAGDGCIQEGISSEASALAAHLALDNLVLIYDSNDVTLDAMAVATQSEDTGKRYEAYGWDVLIIDGHDIDAVERALKTARETKNGKPTIIIAKTIIGKGIPEVQGSSAGHGEGGAKFVTEARKGLGLPEETFFVSETVQAAFAKRKAELAGEYEAWLETFEAWKAANPEKASLLEDAVNKKELDVDALLAAIPEANPEKAVATRGCGGDVLNALAKKLPLLASGSADLHGSTKNYIKDVGDFSRDNYAGRNFLFGIREHAMGAFVNGIAYHGIFTASGATFETFADYMRPALRLAALSKLGNFQIFTHDSIGVGEDGPTHQPIELTSALRLIPNMDVIRPADAEETAGAFVSAVARKDGPTSLVLTRQNLPQLNSIPVETRRQGVLKGAYIARKETADLELILIATGSELQHALKAAEELGAGTRVVSMPSMEIFERQCDCYKESVLPAACTKRIAMEAGVTPLWYKYASTVVGIDKFGISAPGNTVMELYGMTAENLVKVAKSL